MRYPAGISGEEYAAMEEGYEQGRASALQEQSRHPVQRAPRGGRTAPSLSDSEIAEMTYEQRQALPAAYHQPYWDGLGEPHSWQCAVCWDEGLTTGWPCEVATREGKAVAEAGGMRYAW